MFLSFSSSRKDKKWFKKVFDLHFEKIRNFLYYRTGDMDKAEDLCQEVFLKLWEKRKEVDDEKLVSLLFTIASNLFNNQYKREKLHYKYLESDLSEFDQDNPEYLLEVKEFDEQLKRSIEKLPDKCRTVFLLSKVDKHTYKEIAEMLGVSVKTVEKHMHNALVSLRSELNIKI